MPGLEINHVDCYWSYNKDSGIFALHDEKGDCVSFNQAFVDHDWPQYMQYPTLGYQVVFRSQVRNKLIKLALPLSYPIPLKKKVPN